MAKLHSNKLCKAKEVIHLFYETLKKLCTERGIRVTNVISELGMGTGNLSSWKSGNIPKGDTLSKIADYFNVTTDYLLGRTEQKMAAPSEDETAALLQEPYMKEIYETLLRLTPESRKLVLAQIRAVGDFESSAKKEASPPRKDPTQTP